MPAVAVIVRTKDRPVFLRRALRSITGQTLADWECVIVNDGGDPSVVEELIADLGDEYRDRVTATHHDESRGRWVSANAGVMATSAPLLTIHDDDDSWHPEFLQRASEYLNDNQHADGAVSRVEIVWEKFVGSNVEETGREMFQGHLHDVTLADTLLFNRFVPIGLLYRRALHEELGLYDDSLPVVGDWSFYLKVLARGPLPYLAAEPYAYWHQRAEDTSAHGNSVVAEGSAHERHDWLIRDAALREYVAENGLGLVLYLTKFIDRRFVDVENGIRGEIERARAELVELHEQSGREMVAQHDRTRHETQGLITGLFRRTKRRFRGGPDENE